MLLMGNLRMGSFFSDRMFRPDFLLYVCLPFIGITVHIMVLIPPSLIENRLEGLIGFKIN
jgi:hypothetical protein